MAWLTSRIASVMMVLGMGEYDISILCYFILLGVLILLPQQCYITLRLSP